MLKSISEPEVEGNKKELVKIFKNNGLSITLKTNLNTADFLNIHVDLINEIYQTHKKANDEHLYINIKFNQPPSIPQQLPKSISKRISKISSNEHVFKQSIQINSTSWKWANITSPKNIPQHKIKVEISNKGNKGKGRQYGPITIFSQINEKFQASKHLKMSFCFQFNFFIYRNYKSW